MWERCKYQTKSSVPQQKLGLLNFLYYKTTTQVAVNKFLKLKMHFF
jgi:hypothetical protein